MLPDVPYDSVKKNCKEVLQGKFSNFSWFDDLAALSGIGRQNGLSAGHVFLIKHFLDAICHFHIYWKSPLFQWSSYIFFLAYVHAFKQFQATSPECHVIYNHRHIDCFFFSKDWSSYEPRKPLSFVFLCMSFVRLIDRWSVAPSWKTAIILHR